ncbi:hypothetical protein MPER_08889 [Moniliophthora perniciosa FA553]|nr:hypothetical protein MPER_08889 [Moniliophthora perniciosa FA553]
MALFSKRKSPAEKDAEFKSKYPGKTDGEILAEQMKTWANTLTYKHYDLEKITMINKGGAVKYKFHCKSHPGITLICARYDNSTSNLARHVTACSGKVVSETQAITQFSNGCNYDHGAFRLETALWVSESSRALATIEDKRLQRMFQIANAKLELVSADTLSKDVQLVYKMAIPYVAAKLRAYAGYLHFSFDGWTAVNMLSFLGLWVHFLEGWDMISIPLDFIP